MDAVWIVIGATLILAGIFDLFMTVLYYDAAGPLSLRVYRLVWAICRRLASRVPPRQPTWPDGVTPYRFRRRVGSSWAARSSTRRTAMCSLQWPPPPACCARHLPIAPWGRNRCGYESATPSGSRKRQLGEPAQAQACAHR